MSHEELFLRANKILLIGRLLGDPSDATLMVNDLVKALRAEVEAHAATKRELTAAEAHHEEHHDREKTWKPPCVSCESQPHDPGPCDCHHAPCVHDLNTARRDLEKARSCLDASQDALRSAIEGNKRLLAELAEANSETALALDQRDRANAELAKAQRRIEALTNALFRATGGHVDFDVLSPPPAPETKP